MMTFNFLGIALLLAALAVNAFVSFEFYKAAVMKGWPQKRYLYIAFLLPLIGYLLIIALPDRGGSSLEAVESDDLPEL